MIYVLDTNSIRVWRNYYPEAFPTFWERLAGIVAEGRLVSTREVRRELETQGIGDHLQQWVRENSFIFTTPTPQEQAWVRRIFEVEHFQQLIKPQTMQRGGFEADPWLVAKAAVLGANGYVVTEEANRPHAAKIPNVCEHFGVQWGHWQEVLAREGWRF